MRMFAGMDVGSSGPASIAALRDALRHGHEPPPAQVVARLKSYRWFVVGSVCVGAFMGQVDSSIAQMLLPRLELEFGARLSTVSWVAVAYLLAMAALLSSNSVAIVVAAAGPARRGRALGIQSAAQAVGLSAGPTIGGLVLDALDWRWVFWINVPVGLAGTVLGWFVLPPTKDLPADSRFDWTGAFLIAPALTALVAVLNEGYAWGASSPMFIGCALLAVILLTLFVRCEQRAPAPLIDLTLFRQGAFATGNIVGLLAYAALFGLFFLLPFVFVRAYHDSAFAAGLRLTIVPVMLGAVAPLGGALSDRLGPRLLTVAGMLVCVVALALLFAVLDGAPGSLAAVMLALAIFGVGQGLFISPNNSAIVAAAPASLTGEAGGLLNVTRSCGISMGVAAASSLLAWRLALRTGSSPNTLHAEPQQLLAAGRDVIVLLASFAAMAGVISLARLPARRSGDAKDAST